MKHTVKLHRVLRAPPARVYQAFTDPDALVKWIAPHGFTARIQYLEVEVDGGYCMSFRNFSTGKIQAFSGRYHEVIPDHRLRYSDQFDDPKLPGQMETTIDLKAVSVGTALTITQTGVPETISIDACYLGWQESLQLLELLVTAEIPNE